MADDVSPLACGNKAYEGYVGRALDKVRRARGMADFVIVIPHVGGQYNPSPGVYAKWVVEQFKNAGADMVVACHPHVPQRCEKWEKGKPFVVYSLGNCCFTPDVGYFIPNVQSEYGLVLHAYVSTATHRLEKVSFDTVKNCVDEDGCARTRPVVDIYQELRNATARERLAMDVESIVNKVRGSSDNVPVKSEYEIQMTEGVK